MAGGKGGRKLGRRARKKDMVSYHAQNRKAKNKAAKILRHLKKHPNDNQALDQTSRDAKWYKPQNLYVLVLDRHLGYSYKKVS